jgi:hypothetical protein
MPDPIPTPDPKPDPKPDIFTRAWWKQFVRLNAPQFLAWLLATLLVLLLNWANGTRNPIPDPPVPIFEQPPDGWVPPTPEERQATLAALRVARFADTDAAQAADSDADAPVWRLATKGRGRPIPVRDQGKLGSCVSFGFSAAVEYTMASQVAIGKQRQDLPDSCQETIYAGSRVDVNGGRCPIRPDRTGNRDGSTGAWAAKWIEQVGGVLPRGKYGNVDLTAYDVNRCRQWGDSGCPKELLADCKKHQAHTTLIGSTAELKKALQQGYAVGICSNVGYGNLTRGPLHRDADGFLRASGQWGHCMAVIGYRSDKRGFLILNSWGPNWVDGPKGLGDEPDGSFWARDADVQRMLDQQDTYAVANADGFRRRKIQADDWIVQSKPKPHRPLEWNREFFATLAP